jgi:hypothetical protein
MRLNVSIDSRDTPETMVSRCRRHTTTLFDLNVSTCPFDDSQEDSNRDEYSIH